MSEESMVELIQRAIAARGIEDEVLAAGQFYPGGHTGGMFAGGLAGGEAGGLLGGAVETVGAEAGSLAGAHAADARAGLPAKMLVGVSATTVYGFAAPTRRDQPTVLVFQILRSGLTAGQAASLVPVPHRGCQKSACSGEMGAMDTVR